MITVKIKGGLGNQLFQYALGKSIAIQNNTELYIDNSFFENTNGAIVRNFSLDKFNTNYKINTKVESDYFILKDNVLTNKLRYYFSKKGKYWGTYLVEKEEDLWKYNKRLNFNKETIYLDGYWQSYYYFDKIKDILQSELKLKAEYSSQINELSLKANSSNSVAIHIRRGDYVSLGWSLEKEYYSKAVKQISNMVSNQPLLFFIFTDDPDWVKKELPVPDNTIFINDFNLCDYQELALMSECKHNIISNSTFSWWGAWLNSNKEKVIIVPTKWINNIDTNSLDLIPEHWIRI